MKGLLQLALNKQGKLVTIYQVPTGKECNCFCPKCEEPLIAKNKNKTAGQILEEGQKIAHFSHASESECRGAEETVIHMLAKIVLKKFKTLLLPPLIVASRLVSSKRIEIFDKVEIEEPIKTESFTIKPDAILFKKFNNKEYKLLVEFKKTHAVDIEKAEKIKKLNISCIEIDVNNIELFKGKEINVEGIKSLLEEDIYSKKWIYNSKSEELHSKYLAKKNWEIQNAKKEKEKFRAHINNLEQQGYKFIKIYERERDYDGYSLEERAYTETYIEEKIYCPKIIVNERKQKIDLIQCRDCEYYLKTIYKDDSNNYVVCGFENKLKS